ncbi:MAG TPA: Na+:solute symporter [Armatimonadetes bacterium]|nr:Na+:solute symporter [Armatimonadota bacterium]
MPGTPDVVQSAMTSIDWVVIAVYLAFVAAVGFIVKGRIKTLDDYFAGGHRIPWWLAAVSHHISGYSAFAFVGYAKVAYNVGINIWTLFAIPCFLAMTAGAFIWAPRWVKLKVISPVEYLEKRFNPLVHQAIAWSGIAVKFVDEGLKLYSLAVIIGVVCGFPLEATIVVCGVVAILYVLVGGLWAEMITDFSQFFVQLAATVALAVVVLSHIGGLSGLWASMPPQSRSLLSTDYDLPYLLVFLVVITLSYNGGTWGLAQRFYSIGKPNDAKKAALLSAALYLVYPIVIYIPVWAAHSLAPELTGDETQKAYAVMAKQYFPAIAPGLLGLFVAAMFAATMSMVDGDLNALAAVFTKDIYGKTLNPRASEKTLFKVGLLATLTLGIITIATGLLAPRMGSAFDVMVTWYAAILAPVSVPLLFGMLNRRTTWRGAMAAWAGGFITFVAVKYGLPALGFEFAANRHWTIYTGAELIVIFGIFYIEGYINKLNSDEQKNVDELFTRLEGDITEAVEPEPEA